MKNRHTRTHMPSRNSSCAGATSSTRSISRALPRALLASAVVGALLTPAAFAANYQVGNTSDAGPGSLRDALNQANASVGVADVITFADGVSGTIALTTGTLSVTDPVDIQGPGASVLTVDGSGIVAGPTSTDGQGQVSTSDFTIGVAAQGPPQRTGGGPPTIPVTISGLTISGGSSELGGGISVKYADLQVADCVISGNTAALGGGINVGKYSTLSITDSTVSNNTALYVGGGIAAEGGAVTVTRSTVSNNSTTYLGGGIYIDANRDNPQPLTISASTISGNSAGNGGGIATIDTATYISESTLSGNTALAVPADSSPVAERTLGDASYGLGGGLWFATYNGAATVNIEFSTITGNHAAAVGGGIVLQAGEPGTIGFATHTAIGGNSAPANPAVGTRGGASMAIDHTLIGVSGDANLVDNGGNLLNQAPMLGPLADNGGPTLTHLPLTGSPLIDAGDPAFAGPPNQDQRGPGFPRVVNGIVDIGAVELAGAPPPQPMAVPGLGLAGKLGLGALLGFAGLVWNRRRSRGVSKP